MKKRMNKRKGRDKREAIKEWKKDRKKAGRIKERKDGGGMKLKNER